MAASCPQDHGIRHGRRRGGGAGGGASGGSRRPRPRVDPVRAIDRPGAAGRGIDRPGRRRAERAESQGAQGPRGDLPGVPRTGSRPPARRRRAAGQGTPPVPGHVRHPVPVQPVLEGDQVPEAGPGRHDGRSLPRLRGANGRGTAGGEGPVAAIARADRRARSGPEDGSGSRSWVGRHLHTARCAGGAHRCPRRRVHPARPRPRACTRRACQSSPAMSC